MYVTTATGFVAGVPPADYRSPEMGLLECGGAVNSSGVSVSGCGSIGTYAFADSASGNSIGSTCGDFVFDTTSTNVWSYSAPPAAPYSGTYQLGDGSGGLVGLFYTLQGLQLQLTQSGHPPDAILQCARVDITTKTLP